MYIQPNSVIRLLTGVPLDNTYAHTIYFASKEAQATYFASKTKTGCTFNNQTYQRVNRGTVRLQVLADDIYDCNYLMFQNTSYGNKWFYAFVTSIEYVSNVVSAITYEIDVMQTWFLFDTTLLQSFVEREHSTTDIVGENIVPEPVPIGEYYMGEPKSTHKFENYDVVIVSPRMYFINGVGANWQWDVTGGGQKHVLDGQPTLLNYVAFNSQNDDYEESGAHYSFLALALERFPDIDDIAAAYLIPHGFVTYPNNPPNDRRVQYLDQDDESNERLQTYYAHHPTSLSHGYTPKNKKLLTYPYNKLVIDTADGNTYEYAFEFFGLTDMGLDSINFKIKAYRGINCSFRAIPLKYKGEDENYSEGCLLTDFPNVGLVTDSFKAWIAQNKTRVALQTASSFIGSVGFGEVVAGSQMLTPVTQVVSKKGAEMMAKGYTDMAQEGVRGVGRTLAELNDRSALRYHPRVGSNDGSLEVTVGKKDFTAIQYSVNPQNAAIIDDFFNVYGYATHRVKVPNINARPHWTYVKTIDINLESNAPADDVNAIAKIFDNGITFWRNASEVGNYSLNNSPV